MEKARTVAADKVPLTAPGKAKELYRFETISNRLTNNYCQKPKELNYLKRSWGDQGSTLYNLKLTIGMTKNNI